MKIFYRLDESKDWIGETEVFIKEEQKDKHGNIIPSKGNTTYTIYFKKALLCSQFKIMMNDPLKKGSFSIHKVKFFTKINRGIIMAPLIDKKISHCWYINSNIVRKNIPVYLYPCTDGISVPNSNEIFQIFPNHQIKPQNSNLCVGHDIKTNDVILIDCTESSSAVKIFYNEDYTMYFNGLKDSPIAVDTKNKNINFINEKTEITVSSEADTNEFKKENLLNEGNSHWESAAGKEEVTLQLLFGKIVCDECPEKGKFESRKIDSIKIKWEKEPSKFSVFLWNPGQSWKTVATYDNYSDKITNINLTQETAAGLMIKISNGKQYAELGNQVAYGITSVGVFFNASPLVIKESSKTPTDKKIFDFETQAILYKQIGNDLVDSMTDLGKNYEKSVATYKVMKKSIIEVDMGKKKNTELCKTLSKLNDIVKNKEVDKLEKFKREHIKQIRSNKFNKYLKKFNDQVALENILGIKTKGENEEEGISKSNPLNFLTSLLNSASGSTPQKGSGSNAKKNEVDLKQETEEFGSHDNPAPNCMQIKLISKSALSGYYFIQPDCADIPLRVFCDFALYEVAVDIYIHKAGSVLETPNLGYLHIKTPQDVRDQCAEVGMLPIELKNKEMTQRIQSVLNASGMSLNFPHFVPLGYDYSCTGIKCSDIFNSLNKKSSDPIMKFFNGKVKTPKKPKTTYQFIGLGDPDEMKLTRYNEKKMEISGIVCSTNITNEKQESKRFKTIDCDYTLNANLDVFISKKEVTVICPKGCTNSKEGVFGAGTYNGKSSICKAAIHAGEIPELGGKIVVRIDQPKDQYAGTNANGVQSSVMSGDGSKSFILFSYKPDCPKKKSMSSFITEKEDVFLDNENILENALKGQNTDVDINSFIENMSKEKPVNKKDLISNNMIPQLYSMLGNNNGPTPQANYRFNQKNNSNLNKMKFPSLPSLPGALNSGSIADAASNISNAAGAGKNALGDLASSLFGGSKDDDNGAGKGAQPNQPSATGKFENPTDLMTNTISSPSLPRAWSHEENKNLLPAMSSPQSREDPTKLTEANKPSSTEPPTSTETPSSSKANPDPPQIAEPELPGKKKPSNPDGAMNLQDSGPDASKNAPDPLENVPDKETKGDEDEEKGKNLIS